MLLGIDIDTHTARAAWHAPNGQAALVPLPDGATSMPALLRQTMHGVVVGAEAVQALVGNSETTVVGCTRLMGRATALPAALLERLPFAVRLVGDEAVCDLLYAEVRAADVYGELVAELVRQASLMLGQPVDEVVLSVPASAEDRFRVQARTAVEARGLRVRRLISQPAAALLALTRDPRYSTLPLATVAVVQCGGGTLDCSIATRTGEQVRLKATAGDTLLGGDDLVWAVVQGLNQRFQRAYGIDVLTMSNSRAAAFGLRSAAEGLLRDLATRPVSRVTLDHGGGFARDLQTTVSQADLHSWIEAWLCRVPAVIQRSLSHAGIKARQLDAVLLTGEWAFVPSLQQTLAAAFGRQPDQFLLDPTGELVARGAVLAGSIVGAIWDVTPYALGINCFIRDVEQLSVIVPANTSVPTPGPNERETLVQQYWTRFPDQTQVTLDVLQYRGAKQPTAQGGAVVVPHECEVLGSWTFDGLRPKRGECAAFTVTFTVDADGILQLYARENATGHNLSVTIDRGIG
jgi:molecular chaperone DnaK